MNFVPPLQEAVLLKRYKRFLADVETPAGDQLTIHCPNTGAMRNCADPGSRIWYSTSSNAKRKYPHTWELVENADQHMVGVNTSKANKLFSEGLQSGVIHELSGYENIQSEVSTSAGSRLDFCLTPSNASDKSPCYVEVKSVSLGSASGEGLFPDAVTARGQKHLLELINIKQQGNRAIMFFCVQNTGITRVVPADLIDPTYGRLLREAIQAGVEVLCYKTEISTSHMRLAIPIPLEL